MEEDLIRRYFNNELSDSERVEIELRQLEDSEFASLMITFQSTRDGVRLAKKESLKNRLKEIEAEKKPKGRFKYIAIAASVAIILGVGGMMLWNQSLNSTGNLYAEYYEPYPNVHSPITRDGDSLSSLEQAFVQYELGEYQKALNGFNTELESNTDQDVLFYKGITLIELGNDTDALSTLDKIIVSDTRYHPQVLWYQAMLRLKLDQPAKAKQKLATLNSLNSGYKKQKVKELLKVLN